MASKTIELSDFPQESWRKIRNDAGVGLVEAAYLMGVRPQTISEWERGHTYPQPHNQAAYAALLAGWVDG